MGTFGGNRNVFFAQIFTYIGALCGHDPRRDKRGRCGRRSADEKAPPAPPPTWWSTITYAGEIDAGIMGNPDSPGSGL